MYFNISQCILMYFNKLKKKIDKLILWAYHLFENFIRANLIHTNISKYILTYFNSNEK